MTAIAERKRRNTIRSEAAWRWRSQNRERERKPNSGFGFFSLFFLLLERGSGAIIALGTKNRSNLGRWIKMDGWCTEDVQNCASSV